MSRLLIVSNRLPVTVRKDADGIEIAPSAGGLATGLRGPHESLGGLWFGWPGETSGLTPTEREEVVRRLADQGIVPIFLKRSEVERYYERMANGVIWPLFHYLLGRVPLQARDWDVYRAVNERFAAVVAENHRDGDLIWVHDYQLLLVPGMLRRLLPEATIGFFLHIPFPSYEVFRLLPWREEILRGLLGADVIGFHTAAYARYFGTSVLRLIGLGPDVTRLWVEGRELRIEAFPMGIDAASFTRLADDPEVQRASALLREEHAGCRLVLGVDRLDYTKGIPRRLVAFERLLVRHPDLRGKVKFLQVAVPSRVRVPAYRSFRRSVDALVGRINGSYGSPGSAPVHYLARNFTSTEVVTMYRAADVMLVTPLRDGMNLVAKEFVASRNNEDGVLVLSELTGAASQLAEALQVNPYDIDAVAEAIYRALQMPLEEQRSRMRRLRERVARQDVHHWVSSFLGTLEGVRTRRQARPSLPRQTSPDLFEDLLNRIAEAPRVALLLNYGGTLIDVRAEDREASEGTFRDLFVRARRLLLSRFPPVEWDMGERRLRHLLSRLVGLPGTSVHLISGRSRDQMEARFGRLGVGLHAEHGLWQRWRPGEPWGRTQEVPTEWKVKVLPLLEQFRVATPGSSIEEKECSLVWKYRQADSDFGALQAKELRLHLLDLLSNLPVRILPVERGVEIRAYGVHKGTVLGSVVDKLGPGHLLVAMGNDESDEDLFAALPAGGIAIHVGSSPSRGSARLRNPAAARRFLARVVERRMGGTAYAVPAVGAIEARRRRRETDVKPAGDGSEARRRRT